MILHRILEHKRAELRHKQSRGYITELKGRIADRSIPKGFINALEAGMTEDSPALIAEVKKASPSQGLMRPEFQHKFDPVDIAKTYERAGASAISVLTDQEYFQGCLDYLAFVKDQITLPTLNKEFMLEEIQFYEARAYGADCILLIVAALDRIQLQDLYSIARGMDLDVLIETHDERELDTVLERIPDARMIGINNRDLRTFSIDLGVTERLAKRIPAEKLIVSESGIHKRDDVIKIKEAGAKAMLIGESLIRADNIEEKIQELRSAPQPDSDPVESTTRWV
ncbi:MAG: indole-3-glycerol-phosphate synthase [Nitrospirales bacterium]|nr:MAG: indole-3-glycerol-phosphate synthase [Nitrospirales bacterium]